MSNSYPPSVIEQGAILHAFIARADFSPASATEIATTLRVVDDEAMPGLLRAQLRTCKVRLTHMQALQVCAKMRGRRGLNDRPRRVAFSVDFAGVGIEGFKGGFSSFNDAAHKFVSSLGSITGGLRYPFTVNLTRNERALMCSFGVVLDPGSALAVISLADDSGIEQWLDGMPQFLEAIRRLIEESSNPGVLNGYACARYGIPGSKNCGRIEVFRGGLRVASGNEIEAYSALLERHAPAAILDATVLGASIVIGDDSFSFTYTLRETEPLIRLNNYVSPEVATRSLLKRAQRFATRESVAQLLKPPSEIRIPSSTGLPQTIFIDEAKLTELLLHRGVSEDELAARCELAVSDFHGDVQIAPFVRIATFLEVDDFNVLVGKIPKDRWVDITSPRVLQDLLDETDTVGFAVASSFEEPEMTTIKEAIANLRASRWAEQHNRAGIVEGLDLSVHSIDAEEFLDELGGVECTIRAGVKPFFTDVPDHEVPAIGKRVVIAVMQPSIVAA